MTSTVLSALYGTQVDVLRVRDRVVVVGADGADAAHCHGDEGMNRLISFDGIGELLALPFVQSALIACAVLGLVAGLLAPLIVARGMSFAVPGPPSWRSPVAQRRCWPGSACRSARSPEPWWPAWFSACSDCASASATR